MQTLDAPPASVINKDPRDAVDPASTRLHVVCVPQAGMGAWAFHGWQAKLPASVEILPVEMPGRNSRMMEPKPKTMASLVRSLVDGLLEYGAFAKPFVLLGHSLGAWVAFEILAELLRRAKAGHCLLLIVSGARAPHLYALEHDADRVAPAFAATPPAEFWEHFERRYGKNPDMEGMLDFALPLLRADFGIVETYVPSREKAPLPVPVIACSAHGDNRLKPGQMAEWAAYHGQPRQPSDDAREAFREETFTTTALPWSTPHRYLIEDPAPFQAFLAREAQSLLQRLHTAPATPAAMPPPAATLPAASLPTAALPATAPPPPLSVAQVLEEAKCEPLADILRDASIADWLDDLSMGRPTLLRRLANAGVTQLRQRQAIANALGKLARQANALPSAPVSSAPSLASVSPAVPRAMAPRAMAPAVVPPTAPVRPPPRSLAMAAAPPLPPTKAMLGALRPEQKLPPATAPPAPAASQEPGVFTPPPKAKIRSASTLSPGTEDEEPLIQCYCM